MKRTHHTHTAPPLATGTSHAIRVTYRDTDQMSVAYHANYFAWFEIGRTELLRNFGRSSYRDWEAEGIFLPVRSCWAEFHRGARYDELIEVVTTITAITRASITFEYKVRPHNSGETGEIVATGGTRHAFIDRAGAVTRSAHRLLPELFT